MNVRVIIDLTVILTSRYLIVTPNNINAAGVVIQYWNRNVHIAVWMGTSCDGYWRAKTNGTALRLQ